MSDYIKRENAITLFERICDYKKCVNVRGGMWCDICAIGLPMSELRHKPAADVAPVKHGRWVTKKDVRGTDYTICSACETEIQWRDRRGVMLKVDMQNAPFCPNCGAKMDEVSE